MTDSLPSLGRCPPYSEEAERSVLGSIMLDSTRVVSICFEMGVKSETFYVSAMRTIWDAVVELASTGAPVDAITLEEQLKTAGMLDSIGGPVILGRIQDLTPTAAHAEYYIGIIRQKEKLRAIAAAAMRTEAACFEGEADPEAILSQSQADLLQLSEDSGQRMQFKKVGEFADGKMAQWEEAQGKGYIGIKCSIPGMSEALGGWRPVLHVFGSVRGQGKSTFGRQECFALGKAGTKSLLFTLEDPGDIAAASAVCGSAGVDMEQLDNGRLPEGKIETVGFHWKQHHNVPWWIVEDANTMDEIETCSYKAVTKYGVEIIFLDLINNIQPCEEKGKSRYSTLSNYCQRLQALQRRLKIPFVVFAHIGRDPEKQNRAPTLSDFRDCGIIENVARVAVLLYWDDDAKEFIFKVAKKSYGAARSEIRCHRQGNLFVPVTNGQDFNA